MSAILKYTTPLKQKQPLYETTPNGIMKKNSGISSENLLKAKNN